MICLFFLNLKVVLDPMPDEFIECINSFNDVVNAIFFKNLKYQNDLDKHSDLTLPLSKYDFCNTVNISDNEIAGDVNEYLEKLVFDSKDSEDDSIVSNFAVLSGFNDKHTNFHIKDKSTLMHIKSKFLSFKDLYPTLEVDKDFTDFYGNQIKLNSYFLDFYKHGIFASIIHENKLEEARAFECLQDFSVVLSNFHKIIGGKGLFLEKMKKLSSTYSEYFAKGKQFIS